MVSRKILFFQAVSILICSSFAFSAGITYEYDSRHRLRKATYVDGTVVAYAYDNIGNRVSMAVTVPDIDGDGMSDTWEKRFFGNMSRDGGGDFDGDGITDLNEYRSGTNPAGNDRGAGGGSLAASPDEPQPALLTQIGDATQVDRQGIVAGTPKKRPTSAFTGALAEENGTDRQGDGMEEAASGADDVRVVVEDESGEPFEGLAVRVFAEETGDVGIVSKTGKDGLALFHLGRFDGKDVRFRVDYLAEQFWSDWLRLPSGHMAEVVIAEATVEVEALGDGANGAKIYLCDEAGRDLNRSYEIDETGFVTFELPVGGKFRFRIESGGGQCWSEILTVKAGEVNRLEISSDCGVFTVARLLRTTP